MMTDSTNEARAKVIDFGLARFLHPGQTANDAFGTPGYTAPEVLQEKNYSFACDVWSLGCILFALLAGMMPFDCQSNYEQIKHKTLNEPLEFDPAIWDKYSVHSHKLIKRMLRKNPKKRITLLDALEHPFFLARDDEK